VSFGRYGLYGNRVEYVDTAPPAIQSYQIARGACAYILRKLGLLRTFSPHDLAVSLCGVSCVDVQADERRGQQRPTRAPVVRLVVRARRGSGVLPKVALF
jgi:hypothetical protein